MAERVSTGIKGLDKLIEGGLPKGSLTLVSGPPGSGKSVWGMQYLNEGGKKGEKWVFISVLGEKPEQIVEEAKKFGFDLGNSKGKIMDVSQEQWEIVINNLMSGSPPQRILVDSVSSFVFSNEVSTRRFVHQFGRLMKEKGSTAVFTCELPKEWNYYSRDTVSEFIADGIITLDHMPAVGGVNRTLTVIKMRGTKINDAVHPMEITSKGIVVLKRGKLYK